MRVDDIDRVLDICSCYQECLELLKVEERRKCHFNHEQRLIFDVKSSFGIDGISNMRELEHELSKLLMIEWGEW